MDKKYMLGIIDAQRGFMPANEGAHLDLLGFGELPVPDGQEIIPRLNQLLGKFAVEALPVFTTQDWHPRETAHFSEEPNYNTTWPIHCVQYTPGAALHPELKLPRGTESFTKGSEKLEKGEDDTSYSGYNAEQREYGRFSSGSVDVTRIEQFFNKERPDVVILGGLALDYCVKATALDLRNKAGVEVIIASDATKPVAEETGLRAIEELEAAGVHFATTAELLERLAATAA